MMNFIENTRNLTLKKIKNLTLPKTQQVLIGRKYQAVLLDGYLGVAFAPRKETSKTCRTFKNPGYLFQTPANELLDFVISNDPIERSLGFASMNALSQLIIASDSENYNRYSQLDILKVLPITKETKVGMVGMIGPFIKPLIKSSKELFVLDDNPKLKKSLHLEGFQLTQNLYDMEDRDVMIITGSIVIEHSIEEILNITKSAVFRVIVGPTASWIPDFAFELGVDAVSGMKFKDSDTAFRIIMEGGGTMDFAKHAEKYTISKEEI